MSSIFDQLKLKIENGIITAKAEGFASVDLGLADLSYVEMENDTESILTHLTVERNIGADINVAAQFIYGRHRQLFTNPPDEKGKDRRRDAIYSSDGMFLIYFGKIHRRYYTTEITVALIKDLLMKHGGIEIYDNDASTVKSYSYQLTNDIITQSVNGDYTIPQYIDKFYRDLLSIINGEMGDISYIINGPKMNFARLHTIHGDISQILGRDLAFMVMDYFMHAPNAIN